MKLIPCHVDLESALERLEKNPGFGFYSGVATFQDNGKMRTVQGIEMQSSPRYAKACRDSSSGDYAGRYWGAEIPVWSNEDLLYCMPMAQDALSGKKMLGQPSRIEGLNEREVCLMENPATMKITLRYDFLPEQLPSYEGLAREYPLVIRFVLGIPSKPRRSVIQGSLGEKANFILYPPAF